MYVCIVEGRKRPDPRVHHPNAVAAALEAHRLRELPENHDRAVHVAQIIVTLPALAPKVPC